MIFGCEITLVRSNGVAIDFIFENATNWKKWKFERKDISDRPSKQRKTNDSDAISVEASSNGVEQLSMEVEVNNTNVPLNNNKKMTVGVDLSWKDLFVSVNHPDKKHCKVKH